MNVKNLAQSEKFYAPILATLVYVIRVETDHSIGFGTAECNKEDDPGGDFWLTRGDPFLPRSHIAFRAKSASQVVAFYEVALVSGARDNGAPGLRPDFHENYFAAFVYDLDEYNIETVFHGGG